MSRYIDADKLIELANNTKDKTIDANDIARFPIADVRENVRGKWIDEPVYKQTMDGKTRDGFTYCSECKKMHEYGYRSKYCPNCGAEMGGES